MHFLFHISNTNRMSINWTSQLNLSFKILTKSNFRISTKFQFSNLNQTLISKYGPNFNFKISTELQLKEKSHQTSASMNWTSKSKLSPTHSSSSTSDSATLKNILKFWVGLFDMFEMVQKGPEGPKSDHFGPFWTTWQACLVWSFLVQNWPFSGHPQSWIVDPRVKKRLITTSPMCRLLVRPKVFPFGI